MSGSSKLLYINTLTNLSTVQYFLSNLNSRLQYGSV